MFIGPYCDIGKGCKFGKNVTFQGRNRTGDECFFGDNVTIKYGTILTHKVTIGENTFIGPNVITLGSDVNRKTTHGTIIGQNCFIGAGVIINPGVKICNNVTVGAMSFVTKDITEEGTYVGVPARNINCKVKT